MTWHTRHEDLALALADIGTDAARTRLEQLAQSANPIIREYARKRLDNWQEEISRKRKT